MESNEEKIQIPEKKKKQGNKNRDKSKDSLNKFDPRGVQTLFRTLSRNHYNLLRQVDNKASIILTINSIISSLLMGALFIAPESERVILEVSSKIMILFSMLSMMFALISMLPHKYIGKKYKGSGYQGSLYAGNFSGRSLDDFKLEFERIMENGKSIYDEMITDLYFLGQTVDGKQKMLILSFVFFLLGMVLSIGYNTYHGLRFFN